ncbi:cytochrome P450 [Mollisia scopiformis]|uniref:Cytochrome P450 n=1 Tax=Mollisia scopiformis TaxID=149040 RepID=A0A194X568_MOLSC|nr:cytochrome P450 [Mollisia scopiformis]KUJ14947.1 cytochrome P450 [Mollisia scopiformis]
MEEGKIYLLVISILAFVAYRVVQGVYNVFLHPLSRFPGPRAAAATSWWKTYVEVVRQESMVHVLVGLHKVYGDIVRVGPNELHFANPEAYHDIYRSELRWDKEAKLYESFGEDRSSFGLLRYGDAKQRKEVLQPLFSRRAILGMQELVGEKVDHLVQVLVKNQAVGKSSDMLFALRCFTVDMILDFCFAKSVDAMDEPDFAAPIVVAMDNSLPTFHMFHHFPWFRKTILSLPPWLALKASPETAGLTQLQVILGKQVKDVTTSPSILEASPHPTIYHRLLDPKVRNSNLLFEDGALFDEALTMLFAGGVTVGDTSMTGFFHILDQPTLYSALRSEVLKAWPNINNPPTLEALESLPLLTATIKESLRVAPGACSPLLRIVPPTGATINGTFIPASTIVGMSSFFVHQSAAIFSDPGTFNPYRWISPDSSGLEKWLVAFSKGPRSCLGMNLAWCELYLLYATLLRRVEMRLDGTKREDLEWRDCFTPFYPGRHLRVFCEGVEK